MLIHPTVQFQRQDMYRETSGKQNQDRCKAMTRRDKKAKNYIYFHLKVKVRVEGKNITHKCEWIVTHGKDILTDNRSVTVTQRFL